MRVNMIDRFIRQQSADHGVRFAGLGKRGIGHHSRLVERPQRKDSSVKRRRDLIFINRGLGCTLADEDGVACAIGIVAVVRAMVDEQQGLPGLGVIQRDPAWEGWPSIGSHANDSLTLELGIVEADKVGEF